MLNFFRKYGSICFYFYIAFCLLNLIILQRFSLNNFRENFDFQSIASRLDFFIQVWCAYLRN